MVGCLCWRLTRDPLHIGQLRVTLKNNNNNPTNVLESRRLGSGRIPSFQQTESDHETDGWGSPVTLCRILAARAPVLGLCFFVSGH